MAGPALGCYLAKTPTSNLFGSGGLEVCVGTARGCRGGVWEKALPRVGGSWGWKGPWASQGSPPWHRALSSPHQTCTPTVMGPRCPSPHPERGAPSHTGLKVETPYVFLRVLRPPTCQVLSRPIRHPSTIPLPGHGGAHTTFVTSGGQERRVLLSSAPGFGLGGDSTRTAFPCSACTLHLISPAQPPFRMCLFLA